MEEGRWRKGDGGEKFDMGDLVVDTGKEGGVSCDVNLEVLLYFWT
jgi:hypothetical protein